MREVFGDPGESIARLAAFLRSQSIQIVYNEKIAPALGMSYGGRIAVAHPGQSKAEEFSTLVPEAAHDMMHKAERRTATTMTVCETEAEAMAFVVGERFASTPLLELQIVPKNGFQTERISAAGQAKIEGCLVQVN